MFYSTVHLVVLFLPRYDFCYKSQYAKKQVEMQRMILLVRLFTGLVCTSLLLYLGIALYIASVHKPKSTWGTTQRRDVQPQAVKILQTTKSKESNTIHEGNEKPITTIQKPVNITRQQIKTIILIFPFRNRKVHYEKMMKHLKTIHRPDWDIHKILVEQANDEPFQRAWLLNIGIAEAKRRFGNANACVVTHDIDMFADEKVDYSWCDRPTQICSELSCYNWKIPYRNSAGGVVQANMGHWYKINGFTNNAKGWGGEDDDLHHRFRINGLLDPNTRALRRPVKGYGRCTCMHDEDHTKRVRDNRGYADILKKLGRMSRGSDEWKTDGLNSLKYYITSEHRDMFDTIHLKVHHSLKPSKDKSSLLDPLQVYGAHPKQSRLVDTLSRGMQDNARVIKNLPKKASVNARQILEFMHIPKTGGSAIEKAGASRGITWGACHFWHDIFNEMGCKSPPDLQDKIKTPNHIGVPWHIPFRYWQPNPMKDKIVFTVVRNPYSRMLSLYNDRWCGYKKKDRLDPRVMNAWIQSVLKSGGCSPVLANPQSEYVFDKGKKVIDHVLKYETLKKDFDQLMKAHNIDLVLPTIPFNKGKSGDLTVGDFDAETVQMIQKKFREDFDYFHYNKSNLSM